MAHPVMFDEADPMLARVRELCRALPEADEKVSHGRPAFFTQKVFAYYGASLRDGSEWVQHPQALVVRAEPHEQEALRTRPEAFVPAYLGPSGWTGIDLDEATDWTRMHELVVDSYILTAPARLRRAVLDG